MKKINLILPALAFVLAISAAVASSYEVKEIATTGFIKPNCTEQALDDNPNSETCNVQTGTVCTIGGSFPVYSSAEFCIEEEASEILRYTPTP